MNEKMSTAGTRPLLRIHSPVRMCHPVSESVRSQPTPVVHQNNTRIGIRKAASDRDGRGQSRAAGATAADLIAFACSPMLFPGTVSSLREDTHTSNQITVC